MNFPIQLYLFPPDHGEPEVGNLFIPLKAEFFDAFANGEKTVEYRKAGGVWNEVNCQPGRRVTISRGYGKQARLDGVVASFAYYTKPELLPGWCECYGDGAGEAACITIILDKFNTENPTQ